MPLASSTNLDNIYNQLVAVLKTVTDPNNASALLFQNSDSTWNIYDGPVTGWAGTPAAVIIPSDGPGSKFVSNYENVRGYGFYVFIAMDTQIANYAATRKNMRLITDVVLDAIDRSDMLNGSADIVEAVTMKWIEENGTNGVNIVAPLEVKARKTVEVL